MNQRVAARIAESDRLQRGQEAEGQGLRAAQVFNTPFQFSTDPARQARFELGFREGRALMEVDDETLDREGPRQIAAGGLRDRRADDSAVRPPASGESAAATNAG
jgi:hypothetical protein